MLLSAYYFPSLAGLTCHGQSKGVGDVDLDLKLVISVKASCLYHLKPWKKKTFKSLR